MLNVLILDDQMPTVSAIAELIDWKSLLIDHVYQACTPANARIFFQTCQIDLLLCDIEMPQENGIEFVTWVRRNHPLCECIFISSHADFQYAQTALSLGCFEYILQPVTGEALSKSISRAVAHIIDSRKMREYYQSSQYGKFLQRTTVRKAWKFLLTQAADPGHDVQSIAGSYGISCSTAYLPILIHIRSMNVTLLDFDMEQMTENIVNRFDTFSSYLKTVTVVTIDDTHLVLISDASLSDSDDYQIPGCLQLVSEICHDKNGCRLQYYIGTPALPQNLHAVYRDLQEMSSKNTSTDDGIFYLEQPVMRPEHPAPLPDANNWPYMITAGKIDQVISTIRTYLQNTCTQQSLCSGQLFPLQRLIDKAFCDSLDLRCVPISSLIENQVYQTHYMHACKNPDLFHKYLDYLVSFNSSLQIFPQEGEHSVVAEIQKYIDENIEGDLSRSTIARHVYLSEDYISHIFKRETGTSLINYINHKKMILARKLLTTTALPVNLVAARVGFTNFSYFTKLFKKTFGIAPAEYKNSQIH